MSELASTKFNTTFNDIKIYLVKKSGEVVDLEKPKNNDTADNRSAVDNNENTENDLNGISS